MSGIDLAGRRVRKGAADSVRRWVLELGGDVPDDLAPIVERIAASGGTPWWWRTGRGFLASST